MKEVSVWGLSRNTAIAAFFILGTKTFFAVLNTTFFKRIIDVISNYFLLVNLSGKSKFTLLTLLELTTLEPMATRCRYEN
ncbi:hypothetical protein B7486_40415 [cyanobacterium TDX16]|nr:hypothetical protein B7486_40415 [cyanobacterium TDX16]